MCGGKGKTVGTPVALFLIVLGRDICMPLNSETLLTALPDGDCLVQRFNTNERAQCFYLFFFFPRKPQSGTHIEHSSNE